jgi:FixJ family two-component response regulator
MQTSYHYSALNVYETCIIIGLQQGREITQIANDLDITKRSAECMLTRIQKLYQCNDTKTLLQRINTLIPLS